MGDALFRRKCEIIHPVHRLECGNHVHAKGIDSSLNQQLSYRLTGLLQRRNASITERGLQKPSVNAECLFIRAEHGDGFSDMIPGQGG